MINNLLKFLIIFFVKFIPKKNNIKSLENLNFRKRDFSNYKKIKLLFFKTNFTKNNKEPMVYNFDFLNYSSVIGGKKGIQIGKKNLLSWYKNNKSIFNKHWKSKIIANRIINLIYNFEFINSISSGYEEKILKKIIIEHIYRLNIELYFKNSENINIVELKAYILTNFISNKKNIKYEKIFENIIHIQLDNIFIHKSYNLLEHSIFINHISEIIDILLRFGKDVPNFFYITKLKMITALSHYFHKDRTLALFNGSHNNYIKEILMVLKQEKNIRKIEYSDDKNGIYFFEDKNKKIFFDVVQPTKSKLSKNLNASTLAIEFSSDKEKIITNCGALERAAGNATYLRYTAAHSTIILQNTNISEIRENQTHLNFPQSVDFKQSESENWLIKEGSHNGYYKNYNKIIKRKIFFKKDDFSLYGEDHIISSVVKNKDIVFHIRFHIMPNINITETNNKKAIILKTKIGSIWTFKSNLDLVLEESIMVDNDDTQKINQIVIKGIAKKNREIIKWSLIKI